MDSIEKGTGEPSTLPEAFWAVPVALIMQVVMQTGVTLL